MWRGFDPCVVTCNPKVKIRGGRRQWGRVRYPDQIQKGQRGEVRGPWDRLWLFEIVKILVCGMWATFQHKKELGTNT